MQNFLEEAKTKAERDALTFTSGPGKDTFEPGGYSGGFDPSTGNYNDPYDPGFAD